MEAAICAEIELTEKQRQMRVERCLEMIFIDEVLFDDETQYQVNRLMRLILNLFLDEVLFEDETQYQVNRLMRLILNLFLE